MVEDRLKQQAVFFRFRLGAASIYSLAL